METLFDPGDMAVLRRTLDRIPMSANCAAAIEAVKSAAAQERGQRAGEQVPISNLEYRRPSTDALSDRRPSSAASLTEAVTKILEMAVQPTSAAAHTSSAELGVGKGATTSGRMVRSGMMSHFNIRTITAQVIAFFL